MKRGSPGTKRKKATPVAKPAAKRTVVRAKTKTAKATKTTKSTKATSTRRPVRASSKPARKTATKKLHRTTKKTAIAKAPAKRKNAKLHAGKTGKLLASKIPSAPKRIARPRSSRPIETPKLPPAPVPQFLLEGDEPGFASMGGLAEKFSLGPLPPLDHVDEASAPLPESYGTGKIFLTARDPHWLYAHWDLPREEQFRHNARSMDRHLVLRVHNGEPAPQPSAEYHVHPESKYWFVHVERAGATYTAELGYYRPGRQWQSLGFSAPQRTPPDDISKDATVTFATIPAELSFATMLAWLQETAAAGASNAPLAHVVDKIRPRAREHFPKTAGAEDWTAEQEATLAALLAAQVGTHPSSPAGLTEEKFWPEFKFNFETDEAGFLSPSSLAYASSFFG